METKEFQAAVSAGSPGLVSLGAKELMVQIVKDQHRQKEEGAMNSTSETVGPETGSPAKKKRARHKKPSAPVTLLVTELSAAKIDEMMLRCSALGIELHGLRCRLRVEQKQRVHERRMATLKQAGSAVAFLPVTVVKGVVSAGRGICGVFKRRFVASAPAPDVA
jgi:hypothetical protein